MSLLQLFKKSFIVFTLTVLLAPYLSANGPDGIWNITKDRWSEADEKEYSNFIKILGETNCNSTEKCLTHSANPYRARNPAFLSWAYSDCSRFPYLLRMYFAYMNKLPFSYVSKVAARTQANDIRYSPNGNTPVQRTIVVSGMPLRNAISEMMGATSSAMFRIPPEENIKSDNVFPDFYSVKIDAKSVRPGTIIYDPNGHVAIVYRVEPDGRVRFFDAHPDNSITRGTYGEKFARSKPTSGAGFKNWRPVVFKNRGVLKGWPNEKISDFNLDQYYGTHPSSDSNWKRGQFKINGISYEYYDWVRLKLAHGNLRFNPLVEFENMLEALCYDVKDRVASVEDAVKDGISAKPHPERLPYNIYGTGGEWEVYSSPSRDARLKTSFREAHKKLEQFIRLVKERSPLVEYRGSVEELKRDLSNVLDRSQSTCLFQYKNSVGVAVNLDLADAEARLWDLSFDPYHCSELRWGAKGAEVSTCPDSNNKLEWYAAEQRLRNQIERTYDTRMDFNLEELRRELPGSGVDHPPLVDFRSVLR